MFTDNEMKLSLKQEKYLCMLNRLDAFRLIKLEQQKQVQKGLITYKSDFNPQNFDFLKAIECENQLEMIDTVLRVRAISN
jgi:hypothetical protein|tara:strand:- start:262 stop:501 length:240 start_codon:yes stop_codon:yes gene_type:complete